MWGGYVLVDGWLAPEHPAKPRTGPKRLTAAPDGTSTQVNQDFGAQVNQDFGAQVTEAKGRQRWQPRGKRSRASRRGRG